MVPIDLVKARREVDIAVRNLRHEIVFEQVTSLAMLSFHQYVRSSENWSRSLAEVQQAVRDNAESIKIWQDAMRNSQTETEERYLTRLLKKERLSFKL